MRGSNVQELDAFLGRRQPIECAAAFKPGEIFGNWRLNAFIGKGGNGEVYRATHLMHGGVAAIKILMKESAADHFRQECRILPGLRGGSFPLFYECGEANGRLYYVIELLEPAPLPTKDAEIAKLLIAVARAAEELHGRGLVHRDIKPQNILYREQAPVLIDFGLVEPIGTPVSRGSGTPKYAAPEQFTGGEISVAADIHALGVLANSCFDGRPPHEWARIINRATSSIPARRYADAADFIRAVDRRHLMKWLSRIAASLLIVGGLAAYGFFWWNSGGEEMLRWRALCHHSTTNLVAHELVCEQYETNDMDGVALVLPVKRVCLDVTNAIEETVVKLAGGVHKFTRPIVLKPGNYRIVGPGILIADVAGSSNVTIRVANCSFQNQTEALPPKNSIHYIVERGTYLNFAKIYRNDKIRKLVEIPDCYGVEVRFKGPPTLDELYDVLDREWRDLTAESLEL